MAARVLLAFIDEKSWTREGSVRARSLAPGGSSRSDHHRREARFCPRARRKDRCSPQPAESSRLARTFCIAEDASTSTSTTRSKSKPRRRFSKRRSRAPLSSNSTAPSRPTPLNPIHYRNRTRMRVAHDPEFAVGYYMLRLALPAAGGPMPDQFSADQSSASCRCGIWAARTRSRGDPRSAILRQR